jgi:hypothetical protein
MAVAPRPSAAAPLREASLGRFMNYHTSKGYLAISASCGALTTFGTEQPSPAQFAQLKRINKTQTAALRAELIAGNWSFTPVFGSYQERVTDSATGEIRVENVDEASFLVFSDKEKGETDAENKRILIALGRELCRKYNQETFLFKPPGPNTRAYYLTARGTVAAGFDSLRINDRSQPYSTRFSTNKEEDYPNKADRRFSFVNKSPDLSDKPAGSVLASKNTALTEDAINIDPTHFYGLPRPKGFTLAEVEHALSLARRNVHVQLITMYPLEGRPTRHSSISLPLLAVLVEQGGVVEEGEDLLEDALPDGAEQALGRARVSRNQMLSEEGQVRYNYYSFNAYGKDILEYYHLQLLAQGDNPAGLQETKGPLRVTKGHIRRSQDHIAPAGDDANLLAERYQGMGSSDADPFADLAGDLRAHWGSSPEAELTIQRQPAQVQLPGVYQERLDFHFTAPADVSVDGSLYLLRHEDELEVYVKAQAQGAGPVVTQGMLLSSQTPVDGVLSSLIKRAQAGE